MTSDNYRINTKASYTPPKGRKGYTVSFRHPIVNDKDSKYGLKVHRGLNTTDKNEAEKLINELNELMSDFKWMELSKREEAYLKFSEIVVDAFYDPMESVNPNDTGFLDRIQMPSKEDDYRKVLIVGTSGAGKTSLVRLLCGTIKENFPSTSSGRTTTCNLEMIMSDAKTYEVVVTFMSRGLIEMYVQECIESAFYYAVSCNKTGLDRKKLSDKLFIHKDLIVRLSYILGDLSLAKNNNSEDSYDDYDDKPIYQDVEENAYEYKQDVQNLLEKINYFVDCLIDISNKYDNQSVLPEDETLNLNDDEDVLLLRDAMVNEVELRFNLLTGGEKLNSKGKWVNAWYFTTECRSEFIKVVKRFSSNAKNAWGGLLTPIVRTMRIKGNFKLNGESETSKIVLFDGQGFGHKTTTTSIPNETVKKFHESDSIIIVDNAQAPILDNVKIALKSVIESGASKKLLMCFTHVDMMIGDNFNCFADKKSHVSIALSSYLTDLKKQNPLTFLNSEEELILNSCFYMSDLSKSEMSNITKKESSKMLLMLRKPFCQSITIKDVNICYDAMTLYLHLQLAIKNFRCDWDEITGYSSKSSKTEHWTRIKALTRRLAYFDISHYNYEIMPLSDFAQAVREQFNIFLNKPLSITPEDTDEEKKVELINLIKSEINMKLADFINEQMWKDSSQMKRWKEAYCFNGKYSTYYRAEKINEIMGISAPQINNYAYDMTNIQKDYVMQFMDIFEKTIKAHNGELGKFNYKLDR